MANADSSDPATLLTIPAEMQKAIADVTDNQGLLALRLTNKELHAAVDDSFLERFFTIRRHAMTLHGLSALVEITMRPHLIRKLKEIVLVYMEPNFRGEVAGEETVNPQQRTMLRSLRVARWKHEFEELFDKGHAERLLQAVLINVVSQSPKLTVADASDVNAETFGCRLLTRSLGLREDDVVLTTTAVDGPTLLSSIELANFPIRDLDIFISDYTSKWCLDNAFEAISNLAAPCWANLRALCLHLPASTYHWKGGQDLSLLEFIEAAANIESLSLKIKVWDFGTDSSHVLARLGEAFKKHALRDIELHKFETELPQHIDFFLPHQKTLRSVVLSGMVLLSGCWSKVRHLNYSGVWRGSLVLIVAGVRALPSRLPVAQISDQRPHLQHRDRIRDDGGGRRSLPS